MMIAILGRQPALGLAELEALYGSDAVRPVGEQTALIDAEIDFSRLGGSLKAARLLDTIDTTNPQKVFDHCRRAVREYISDFPEGKIKLAVSLYGLDMPLAKLNANVLSLKKVVRDAGRSVRAVPNTEPALSSAQTYHNQLTSPVGLELIMIRDGTSTLIGHVTNVQNINEYTERDRERPRRDSRVGMLPPKLAQIIINLAAGSHLPNQSAAILLDPFCGTGVVLQEATLMGYEIYGTDIEERMVRYTRDNLNWLFEKYARTGAVYYETADATEHTWRQPIDIVACEGYLGTPFASEPPEAALRDSIMTCNLIMKKFLRNIHGQLASGTRLCVAVPAWFVRRQMHHLPAVQGLTSLGYEQVTFKHAPANDLIYHREDQIVGRELLVLKII